MNMFSNDFSVVLSQTISHQLHVFGYHRQKTEITFMAAKVYSLECLPDTPQLSWQDIWK